MTIDKNTNPSLTQRLIMTTVLLDYVRLNNISDADIANLYQKIELLHASANDGKEMALNIIDRFDIYDITSPNVLRDKIEKMKEKTTGIFANYQLNDENKYNSMFALLKENGVSKNEAQELAKNLVQKTLHKEYKKDTTWAKKLYLTISEKAKFFKQSLADDYFTYLETGQSLPVVDQLKDNILLHLKGMTFSQDISFNHLHTSREMKDYLRNDCNGLTNGASDVKKDFYKLFGLMAINGCNLSKSDQYNKTFFYQKFCDFMKEHYGDSYLNVIDTALGVGESNRSSALSETDRIEKFSAKCKNIYFKTMAGLLSQKLTYDSPHLSGDYSSYVKTLEDRYLQSLYTSGSNNIGILGIQDIDDRITTSKKEEYKIAQDLKDETSERKIVSYHHKLPIGSCQDVAQFFRGKAFTLSSAMKKYCVELVNNLGNGCLVIGKAQHNKIEPKGKLTVTSSVDDAFLSAEIDPILLKKLKGKVPEYLWNGIERFGSVKEVREGFALPEAQDMHNLRQSLKKKEKKLTSHKGVEKLIQHHFYAKN